MKRRMGIVLVVLALLCVVHPGVQKAAAAAAEEIEIVLTSNEYALEITEPTLTEENGTGTFRAQTTFSDSAVGKRVHAVVAFYLESGQMVGCWSDVHTLAEGTEIMLSGPLPGYDRVGVYFFEEGTLTPIRPAVLRALDGQAQVSAADFSALKSEVEARLEKMETRLEREEIQAAMAKQSVWKNKSAVFVGDSITAGTGTTKTYSEYIDESIGFGSMTVLGVPGSCMSATSDYGTSHSPLTGRWQDIPAADLIVIFIGTNDYGHDTPLGTISDIGDVSFYGALNTIIPGIVAAHPESRVVFMTPLHRYNVGTSGLTGEKYTYDYLPNGRGHALNDYVDAIREVCERWSVPVIDLFAESGIHPAISAHKTSYMPDGIHPNAAGHEKIAGFIQKCLELYGTDTPPMELPDELPIIPERPDNPINIRLQYGNKFVSDQYSSDPARASSVTNLWLTAGQTVTLLHPEVYVWAMAGTTSATSATKTHDYYPEKQWSSIPSYTVQTDGWYGITIKWVEDSRFCFEDGTHSDKLFDYISVS